MVASSKNFFSIHMFLNLYPSISAFAPFLFIYFYFFSTENWGTLLSLNCFRCLICVQQVILLGHNASQYQFVLIIIANMCRALCFLLNKLSLFVLLLAVWCSVVMVRTLLSKFGGSKLHCHCLFLNMIHVGKLCLIFLMQDDNCCWQ